MNVKPVKSTPSPPDWFNADHQHLWHPYTQMATAPPPLAIERAEGAYLYTADGRAILDAISSWWVTLHGHSEPRIAAAIAEQARRLDHVIFAGCTHEPAARLAARLVQRAPAGLHRVFYSDNGSTAVEVALKMAFQHWANRGENDRQQFLALGRVNADDDNEAFKMPVLAIRMSSFRNGVSMLHGDVSRKIWSGLWPELPKEEIPINQKIFLFWTSSRRNKRSVRCTKKIKHTLGLCI